MNLLRFFFAGLVLVAGGLVLGQVTAASTSVASGLDYTRGRYGFSTATEVVSVPLEFSQENGAWIFRAMFSWLTIKGPSAAALTGGDGGLTRPTSASESGAGDVYLDATRRFSEFSNGLTLDATVRVKLPTADERRGLGTGEPDYYAQLTASRTLRAVTPFASVGYRVLGDSALYELRDGAFASGGAHVRLTDTTVLTAAVDWRDRIAPDAERATEAMLAVTHDLSSRWRIFGYALKGFSDASPDTGAGLRVSYRF